MHPALRGLDSSALTALAAMHLAPQGETVRSFAVDFPDQEKHFQAIDIAPTQDTPFVHAVAEHLGNAHEDIILDGTALSAPAVRRAAVGARDLPMGIGDRDNSLYLLFAAVRKHSTVALSGESADEVFGGYPWFHDDRRHAETFPWMAGAPSIGGSAGQVSDDLAPVLDLGGYIADGYRTAVAETPLLDGETGLDARMRVVSHLHLTRMVQMLLDRKDRMSMAVGLEVRVPFCDHRLVQYVFNTPWSMKTFDGREKSLLRAATRELLPESVANRKKSGYPGTFDPSYVTAIQDQAAEVVSGRRPAADLLNKEALRAATTAAPEDITQQQRAVLERALDLDTWFTSYNPTVRV